MVSPADLKGSFFFIIPGTIGSSILIGLIGLDSEKSVVWNQHPLSAARKIIPIIRSALIGSLAGGAYAVSPRLSQRFRGLTEMYTRGICHAFSSNIGFWGLIRVRKSKRLIGNQLFFFSFSALYSPLEPF